MKKNEIRDIVMPHPVPEHLVEEEKRSLNSFVAYLVKEYQESNYWEMKKKGGKTDE